ncbi:MAG TPA: carboxylesterase family protein [Verrucomicrobiae bacterium]|nr:carboxylesterase family protein [Verrucomicrobiae bacterium]
MTVKNRFALLVLSCLLVPAARALDVVATKSGKVSGAKTADGAITSFKGIPFAAPPVGELRWKAPQPVAGWSDVRACIAFGPSPMQGNPAPFSMWSKEFLIPDQPISEDCLYLNVWTGAKAAGEKRPVLVWIYGGGFSSGGSGVPIYDGEAMARKGIIFVSPNYRVGAFGFFAHPELTQESGRHASGNYGLMDQIAALRWVHDNIAAFGGDPANVTVAGQSAGSMSVNCLVASPLAKGLFQRAIGESGAGFSRTQISLGQAEKAAVEAAKAVNASSLAELRAKPAAEVMKMRGMRGVIVDGYVLPRPITEIFAAGAQNQVDLLTGWNQDEGLMSGPPKSAADYKEQIKQQHGDKAEKFLGFYPATDDAQAAASQQNLSRDTIFGAQNYTWANLQAQTGKTRVYVYRFTRKVPGTGQYAKYGAFHTGEVPYAYDNLKFVDRPWEPVDHQLAKTMSAYWANFVKTGTPTGPGQRGWPVYELSERKVMFLGPQVEARPLPDRAALDFLQSLQTK